MKRLKIVEMIMKIAEVNKNDEFKIGFDIELMVSVSHIVLKM